MKRLVLALAAVSFFIATVGFLLFLEQFAINPPDWAVASTAMGYKQVYKAIEFSGIVAFVLLFVGFCGFTLRALIGE